MEKELRAIINRWNASSGSLEDEAYYVEQLCKILNIKDEPKCLKSEREKLSYVWKIMNNHIGEVSLSPKKVEKLKVYLLK